jgi:predicted alpha/beta-hydrolase family hydrolase
VSAVLAGPDEFLKGTGIVFAHGAAFDMNEPLLVHLADGLADRGWLTLRFNFPYRERGKSSPDRQEVLEAAWRAAFDFMKSETGFEVDRVIAAGKSMGGRVASQMAAEGILPAAALVFLGYPLHPPGKKDQLRDSHLPAIPAPMLFFAGDRDAFADLTLLKATLSRLDAADLEVVEGADHSFNLPSKASTSQEAVYRNILQRIAVWLEAI